ncbi:transposase [Streptomyces sp. NPDC048270]|uniref:transposase n=1 Tax=Streptomyces sp. NPDC048270 TaxID=3154615 RepID=UPI0033EDCE61
MRRARSWILRDSRRSVRSRSGLPRIRRPAQVHRQRRGQGPHVFLMLQPLQEIQTRSRADPTTNEWRQRYAIRADCQATVSETVHAHGLRNCRYRGMARTHVHTTERQLERTSSGSASTSHRASLLPVAPGPEVTSTLCLSLPT